VKTAEERRERAMVHSAEACGQARACALTPERLARIDDLIDYTFRRDIGALGFRTILEAREALCYRAATVREWMR